MSQTPRGQQKSDHGFAAMALEESLNYLEQELEEIKAAIAMLYLDIEQPATPRLRKKVGSRSGACLHFKAFGKSYVLACDRWHAPEHNIYALHLALRQWRNIERWGIGLLPVLLHGFETGRTHIDPAESWMDTLGLGPTATLDDAIAVYHRRAKLLAHDGDELARLNGVMEAARAYFAGKAPL